MAASGNGSNGSVFISYSRKDKTFVQKLNNALDTAGVQTWVDWEGIELGSDWMNTISEAIQGNDAFLYVISPDSLKSKVCTDELELSLKLNKKLIPILFREPTKTSKMHEKIASTNWVYLRASDNFEETIPKLVASINTDLDWVRLHTRLLGRALEWERKNHNSSFLLNGTELEDAENWLTQAGAETNRQTVPVQVEYIGASRKQADRRQRLVLVGVSLALVVSIVLSIFAFLARNDAKAAQAIALTNEALAVENQQAAEENARIARANEEEAQRQKSIAEMNENIAKAERTIAQAQIQQTRPGELDTSTLLAIESYRNNPTFQAENLIRINSSALALPVARASQDGAVWNIEWSPDYQYFVTGNTHDPSDEDAVNEACVYQASDGKALYCKQHDNDVHDALFTKDGKYLVTASADQTVKFWNASDGVLVEELKFGGAVLDLDVSESVLAIARDDDYLTLYYLDKPNIKPVDVIQADGVRSVKFSPSGDLLAFGLQNGQVRFWQARRNFFYGGPQHPKSSYVVLAWSPDSQWLASGGGDSVARLTKRDASRGHEITHQDWVEGVAFGPEADWYATASDDNIVRVVDTATGTERFRMTHAHFAQKVTISADGQWIASTGYDEVVRIWDSVSGSQLLEIPLDSTGSAISFNQDATRLVAADEDGNIGLWDISSLQTRTGYMAFTEFVREVRFTPSGEYLVVNSDDFNVRRIPAAQIDQFEDGSAGEIILTTESLSYETAISPDSQWVAVVELDTENAQKNQGTLVSIDGKTTFALKHGGQVTGVAFTSDSQLAVTSGVDGWIRFWDVDNGEQQFSLNNGEQVYSLALSPAGRYAAAGLNGKIRIWDLDTRDQVMELSHAGDIDRLVFNRDGTLLASGSNEGTVDVWKLEGSAFEPAGSSLRVNGAPRALTFSADSKWLAGGGSTSFAYLWDLDTMQEMARISHGNPVTSVSFSPDGTELLTVSRKVVRIWDVNSIHRVPKEELISFACSHLVSNMSRSMWSIFFGEEEYRPICADLPEEDLLDDQDQ